MPQPQPTAEPTAHVVAIEPIGRKRHVAITEWDKDYRRLVMQTVLRPKDREATGTELALFAEQVQRTGLDPFFRQIYGIYRWDGRVKGEVMQVQAGIDGFRLIAERTGKYEGQTAPQWCGADRVWHEVWIDDAPPVAARIGVYKAGRREPTYAVAHWREYVQTNYKTGKPTGKWEDMPANQLVKCAEALALRKCFPAELSGLYTPEEMEQAANRPGLADGQGNGRAAGLVLGADIEAILKRAADLGHAALADRAMAEMQVADAQGNVVPAKAAAFIAQATAELDAMPVDAQVVDGEPVSGDVSREEPQANVPPSEGENGREASSAAPEPSESAAATDPERIAALRRRGENLLSDAEDAKAAGNEEAADALFAEFEAVAAQVEAMGDENQSSLAI